MQMALPRLADGREGGRRTGFSAFRIFSTGGHLPDSGSFLAAEWFLRRHWRLLRARMYVLTSMRPPPSLPGFALKWRGVYNSKAGSGTDALFGLFAFAVPATAQETHMRTIGISSLEMRGIVEAAFYPLTCTCEHSVNECFTVRIEDLHTGKVHLIAEGISMDRFASSREISNLIAELRGQLGNVQGTYGRVSIPQRAARAM
jgi:hypothetical protein